MKTYEVRKMVKARSIADALRKEKHTKVEYIMMTEDDDDEELTDDICIGFNARRK